MTPADLKQKREEAGLSREALAEEMGVSLRTLFRWEAGDTEITPVIERALHSLFDERAKVRAGASR